jgi:uncharacterized membrane protein
MGEEDLARRLGSEDFRGAILEYLSQEINSHVGMIVGFAVVLFAYLDIVVRDFFEPIQILQFRLPSTLADFQCVLIFVVLLLLTYRATNTKGVNTVKTITGWLYSATLGVFAVNVILDRVYSDVP